MDSSAEQTFMRTGRNSGWRPVRLRPVRVSFRCPSGARPLALALGWWWLGFTWAEHAARTPHPRFGDRWQAHARRRASHGVLLALERSSRASVRAGIRRRDRPNGRIDLLRRRGTRARGAACVCGVAGVLQPAALGCSAGSCRPSGSCPSGTGGLRRCVPQACSLCATGS